MNSGPALYSQCHSRKEHQSQICSLDHFPPLLCPRAYYLYCTAVKGHPSPLADPATRAGLSLTPNSAKPLADPIAPPSRHTAVPLCPYCLHTCLPSSRQPCAFPSSCCSMQFLKPTCHLRFRPQCSQAGPSTQTTQLPGKPALAIPGLTPGKLPSQLCIIISSNKRVSCLRMHCLLEGPWQTVGTQQAFAQ